MRQWKRNCEIFRNEIMGADAQHNPTLDHPFETIVLQPHYAKSATQQWDAPENMSQSICYDASPQILYATFRVILGVGQTTTNES